MRALMQPLAYRKVEKAIVASKAKREIARYITQTNSLQPGWFNLTKMSKSKRVNMKNP